MGFRLTDRICTASYKVRVKLPRSWVPRYATFAGKLKELRLLKNFKLLRTTRSSFVCFVEVYKILRSRRWDFLPLWKYSLIDFEIRYLHQNGQELEYTWERVLDRHF